MLLPDAHAAAKDLVRWPPPAQVDKMPPAEQAAWAKENSDLVYLPPPTKLKQTAGDVVLVYLKPDGLQGNEFLLADGSIVETKNEYNAARVIKQLQGGTNPPPGLPKGSGK